jgi:hypothetical protein
VDCGVCWISLIDLRRKVTEKMSRECCWDSDIKCDFWGGLKRRRQRRWKLWSNDHVLSLPVDALKLILYSAWVFMI